uniref:Uncharacterized protein n=1 Tax=Anguilla anguilla TaxID=7936 RepID=A0A0E9PU72_ANGAN
MNLRRVCSLMNKPWAETCRFAYNFIAFANLFFAITFLAGISS